MSMTSLALQALRQGSHWKETLEQALSLRFFLSNDERSSGGEMSTWKGRAATSSTPKQPYARCQVLCHPVMWNASLPMRRMTASTGRCQDRRSSAPAGLQLIAVAHRGGSRLWPSIGAESLMSARVCLCWACPIRSSALHRSFAYSTRGRVTVLY